MVTYLEDYFKFVSYFTEATIEIIFKYHKNML
jgi:hypothetical protein